MNFRFYTCFLLYNIAAGFLISGGFLSIYGYILVLVSIITCLVMNPNAFLHAFLRMQCIPLYLFMLYFLIASNIDVGWMAAIFVPYSTMFFFDYFHDILKRNQNGVIELKRVVVIPLLLYIYLSIKTMLLLVNNPLLLRHLASTETDETFVIGGAFALPYALVVLCPFLLSKVRIVSYRLHKLFFWIVIIIGSAYVVMSTYTTAILLLLVGYLYVLVKRIPPNKRIVVIILGGASIVLLPTLLTYAIDLFSRGETDIVALRLRELFEISQGTDASVAGSGDFGARINLSVSSLKLFLEHPLFGVGPSVNFDYSQLVKMGVGSHAEWFDSLAKYGCFAFLLFGHILHYSKKMYNKGSVALMLFVVLGFFNPILFFTLFYTAFFLAPLISLLYSQHFLTIKYGK